MESEGGKEKKKVAGKALIKGGKSEAPAFVEFLNKCESEFIPPPPRGFLFFPFAFSDY